MSEINPNHQVTRAVSDHWHKIVAVMLHKLGMKEITITVEDIQRMPPDAVIAVEGKGNDLKVWLTDMKTAQKLAGKEGGLPV